MPIDMRKSQTKLGKDFDKINEQIDEIMEKPRDYRKNISTAKTRAGKAPIKKRKRPKPPPPKKKAKPPQRGAFVKPKRKK